MAHIPSDEKITTPQTELPAVAYDTRQAATTKKRQGLSKIGLVFACGTALFSDGYQNGIVGTVNTILSTLYPKEVVEQNYGRAFSSAGFAGIVLGMLVFGFLTDRVGRKFGMLAATVIVALGAALCAGAAGANGSIKGMLVMLIASRIVVGFGVGAEYPCGSVAASENTEDPGIKKSWQHLLFAAATNCAIDWGFVVSAFVPLVLVWVFGSDHLSAVWRVSFGLGVIPPLAVLFWRLRMHEPELYQKESMKYMRTPYWLVFKRFWPRFVGISLVWFIYDFITYPFGIYSSTIVAGIIGDTTDWTKVLGWNVVINLFYIPGCMGGLFVIDRLGPKKTLILGLVLQAIIGFGMSAGYGHLKNNVGGFAVLYGLFLSFGELGPGNCVGLLASKSSPTAVRGRFYGLAAAIGKIGAYGGTWAWPEIRAHFVNDGDYKVTANVYIGAGLALFSALIAVVMIPELPADSMHQTDAEFRAYLVANGVDISGMGLPAGESDIEHFAAPELARADSEKSSD